MHWRWFLLLDTNQNVFVGKFARWLSLLAVLQDYIFYNVEWVEVCKMRQVFWMKLYCKVSGLFLLFFWLWYFLLENLKLKNKLQIWGFEWFNFWSKFRFLGLCRGILPNVILEFFVISQLWWPTFLLSSSTSPPLPP